MEPWQTWIDPLNALAGMTWVVVAAYQDGGRVYPASPRQRVRRWPACWTLARRR